MRRVVGQAPAWMTNETVALDGHWPWWVQWQRYSFMVSRVTSYAFSLTQAGIGRSQGDYHLGSLSSDTPPNLLGDHSAPAIPWSSVQRR